MSTAADDAARSLVEDELTLCPSRSRATRGRDFVAAEGGSHRDPRHSALTAHTLRCRSGRETSGMHYVHRLH